MSDGRRICQGPRIRSPIDPEVETADDDDGYDGGGEEGVYAAPDPRGVRGVVTEEVGRVLQPPVLRHYHLEHRDSRETSDIIYLKGERSLGKVVRIYDTRTDAITSATKRLFSKGMIAN